MSKSRDQLINYLREIDLGGKEVLDVGVQNNPARQYCKGEPSEYLTMDVDKQWEPNFLKDLNKLFDDKFLNKISKFDVVFCLEVLEHCWDGITALRNLANMTREGGVCYISAPFINPIHDRWDYLRYTPEWFEKVLSHVGFKGWKIKYRMASVGQYDLSMFYKKEGMRMSKIRHEMGEGGLINLVGLFVEAYK